MREFAAIVGEYCQDRELRAVGLLQVRVHVVFGRKPRSPHFKVSGMNDAVCRKGNLRYCRFGCGLLSGLTACGGKTNRNEGYPTKKSNCHCYYCLQLWRKGWNKRARPGAALAFGTGLAPAVALRSDRQRPDTFSGRVRDRVDNRWNRRRKGRFSQSCRGVLGQNELNIDR